MKEFITINKEVENIIIEKKSKFITNLFYVKNVEEAENKLEQIRKKYFDAKHNCMAYRILENDILKEKSSDDGEPLRTAGFPMLSILQKNNLVNVLVIVTRYFGGILLGANGLVRAYSNSLINAIEKSDKIKMCQGYEVKVLLNYADFENFKYYCKNNDIYIKQVQYLENIICQIQLEEDKKIKLLCDFETKKLNLKEIKELSIKYISKSI